MWHIYKELLSKFELETLWVAVYEKRRLKLLENFQ